MTEHYYRKTGNYQLWIKQLQREIEKELGSEAGPGAAEAMIYVEGWPNDMIEYLCSDKPIGPLMRAIMAQIVADPSALNRPQNRQHPVNAALKELWGGLIADAQEKYKKGSKELDEIYKLAIQETGWTKLHLQRLARAFKSKRRDKK